MRVLSNLEPNKVFYYFEEICKIPHGSGNVDAISDYLVGFAKERNLFHIQDEVKNVIIVKEATPGYENEPALMIQGHMDMVAVSKPELNIDMTKEPLKLKVEGDLVYAEGTSLGGDDGIAVAYALAILDDDSLKHPRLEVIITVDEEVGLDGARFIDLSMLKGKRLLNLDSEEEGIFLTSCAGGARVGCILDLEEEKREGSVFELTVGGLLGGHSGVEISKERGNSNTLMGRVLWKVMETMELGIASIMGGLADNAIPRETKATLIIPTGREEEFEALVEACNKDIKKELASKDAGVFVEAKAKETGVLACAKAADAKRAMALLISLPAGVQANSFDVPGLVETSLNLGVLEVTSTSFTADYSVRSCMESSKYALIDKMKAAVCLAGGRNEITGEYPGWAYRVDSPLREKMVKLYEEMYGEKPLVEAIHAGLECGLLAAKVEDLDCISFGPNMKDIHTTEETLSISSTKRVYEYLIRLLETRD